MTAAEEGKVRADFRLFLFLIWQHLNLPSPTVLQYDIAHWLQHGPNRRGVQAFRGVGKSWETSAYVVWRVWNDLGLRTLVVSASKDRADSFSTFTKRIISEVSWLKHLKPDAAQGDRDSNIMFDVRGSPAAHAPSVKSVGVYGQMAGSRAGLIVADDVEVPNNSETVTQREKLGRRVAEFAAILSPGGDIVYLGTPQTEDSLYPKLQAEKGYEFRIWPAQIPKDVGSYGGLLGPCIYAAIANGAEAGDPTDPSWFDEIVLAGSRLEYGAAGYQLQFMLDTKFTDAERYPLKLRDFIVMDIDNDVAPEKLVWAGSAEYRIEDLANPGFLGDGFFRPMHISDEFAKFTGTMMYIDPAGRGKDEVSYCVSKFLHGTIFIPQWGGLDGGYDIITLTKLAYIAKACGVREILVEDNFGDGMWAALFQPVLQKVFKSGGCPSVEGERVIGQKEVRDIERIEPALSSHRLVLDRALVDRELIPKLDLGPDAVTKSNFFQLTRITRQKGCLPHDDRLDALAGAVFFWQEDLSVDTDQAALAAEEERRDLALEAFMERAGGQPLTKTWSEIL